MLLIALSIPVGAALKVPAVIGSNMVLQQQTDVQFWGWSDAGKEVTIKSSWDNHHASVITDVDGNWRVKIQTPSAGGPYQIGIYSGSDTIRLENVLIGEVWFCSGQSNMEYPLGKTPKYWHAGVVNYEEEVAKANYPNIRLFTVKQRTSEVVLDTLQGNWNECNSANVNDFSAVAYYYGRMLNQKLNVPVGLIHASWGGTPAESWTRKEVLTSDTAFRSILEKEAKAIADYPLAYKKYKEKFDAWKKGVEDGTITGRSAQRGPSEPIGPGHSKMPSVLYNGMVAPVIPFTIKGAIWYQGESNNDDTELYGKLFPAMIQNWRNDWGLGDFPFYFVQIAAQYRMKPELRQVQMATLDKLKNVGMAVTLDVGDSTDIHPRRKQPVGERLALWSLANTYNQKDLVYSGPLFKSVKTEKGKIVVSFNHVGSGLVAVGGALKLFEVAGSDKVFVPAEAVIKDDKVIVGSEKVIHPVYVRYAWFNYMKPDLFNKEGLPASSFTSVGF